MVDRRYTRKISLDDGIGTMYVHVNNNVIKHSFEAKEGYKDMKGVLNSSAKWFNRSNS